MYWAIRDVADSFATFQMLLIDYAISLLLKQEDVLHEPLPISLWNSRMWLRNAAANLY